MCWAGAWLYIVTEDEHYLQVAEGNYIPGAAWGQSWDEKIAGCMVGEISTHVAAHVVQEGTIELPHKICLPSNRVVTRRYIKQRLCQSRSIKFKCSKCAVFRFLQAKGQRERERERAYIRTYPYK